MNNAYEQNDLVSSKMCWVLWGIPTAFFILGGLVSPPLRVLLWTPALLVAGGACVVNAARCSRLHCHITGPLYLIAAGATVLRGLDVLPLQWWWIGLWAIGGTLLAYVPEWLRGKYWVRPSTSSG